MANSEVLPALSFLTEAAHLMRAAAPETSSHLMSQRGQLMFEHDMAVSELQKQHSCSACGHIMMPGHESTLKLENRNPPRRPSSKPVDQRKARPQGPKDMIKTIQCGRCHITTRISLPSPAPVTRRKISKKKAKSSMQALEPLEEADAPVAPKPSANASSKKRAKNRKAGLQALLAGQQQTKKSPLSLSDFMRK